MQISIMISAHLSGVSLRATQTWNGGVTGRSCEASWRGGRILSAAVQQLQKLQSAGEFPGKGTEILDETIINKE